MWGFKVVQEGKLNLINTFEASAVSYLLTISGQSRSYGQVQVMRLWYVFHTYERHEHGTRKGVKNQEQSPSTKVLILYSELYFSKYVQFTYLI